MEPFVLNVPCAHTDLAARKFYNVAAGVKAPPRKSGRVKLYVGSLSFYTIAETLVDAFSEFGTVHDCYLPEDPSTGARRGFAFVTMDKADALRAISELDGCEIDGRIIQVNEAQAKRSAAGSGTIDESDPETV